MEEDTTPGRSQVLSASNVTPIEEGRKSPQGAKRSNKAPKTAAAADSRAPARALLYRAVAEAIDGTSPVVILPPFPSRWLLVQRTEGDRLPASVDAGEVVTIYPTFEEFDHAVLSYCNTELVSRPDYAWTAEDVARCRKYWVMQAQTTPLSDIRWVRWADEPGLCLRRLPWSLAGGQGQAPTFDALLGRCTNAEALLCWIGSLLDPLAYRQQYVWMHGKGQDGKGALTRFLAKVFGPAASSQVIQKNGNNQFWTSGLLGKRFVYFPDCNHYGYPASGEFKMLSGGDPIRVEKKGGSIGTAEIPSMFLFCSNEKPGLAFEKADLRRVIYVEVEPFSEEVDALYEQRLWAEGGDFLSAAVYLYQQKYQNHGPISAETGQILDIVADLEQEYETFFDENFELDDGLDHSEIPYRRRATWATPDDFQKRVGWKFKLRHQRVEFLRWLERHHPKVQKTPIRWPEELRRELALAEVEKRYAFLRMRDNPMFTQDTSPRPVATHGTCSQDVARTVADISRYKD